MSIKEVGRLTSKSEWIVDTPKLDLHIHLEGAMRPATVPDLSVDRMRVGPLNPDWETAYYTFSDFAGFMRQLTPRIPSSADEYGRVARECFEDLAAQGVLYSEVSFGPPVSDVGDDRRFWPIVEAMEEARRAAEASLDISIRFIAGLMRSLPVEVGIYNVRLAAQARDQGIAVVGIDLHGDEINYPASPFAAAFQEARDLGFGLRAHAGEASGAHDVEQAIKTLGVQRIAHGQRAIESQEVMDLAKQRAVTFDMALTSNVRTGGAKDLPGHPIREFFEAGLAVTVNSDDPLPFFTNVEREYRLLIDELAFERRDVETVALNAVNAAFLTDEEKEPLRQRVEASYSSV
jgi:aminodeoxyfutalosine deaminase